MRMVIVGLVVLALLAAGGVVVLVKRYLDAQTQKIEAEVKVEDDEPEAVVLVANANLPAGTKITSSSLRWQEWPKGAVESNFISSSKKDKALEKPFIGAIVRRGLVAGVPLSKAMVFKRDAPGFLAGALEPGMRAVSISVSPQSGASGFILPGDHVDVLLTHDVRRDAPSTRGASPVIGGHVVRYTAETVIKYARVIAIDQNVDDFGEKPVVAKTVTLEVSAKQAEILAVARSMGKLGLTLRSHELTAEKDMPSDKGPAFTTDLQVSPTLSAVFGSGKKKGASRGGKVSVKVYRGGAATVKESSGR